VRAALGPDFPVLAKMNLDDGVPHGLHIDEAVECARQIEARGATGLVLSGGLVSHSALYLLRGERPLQAMIEVEPSRLQKVALRLFGPRLIREVPFDPMFFLPLARQVRAAVRLPLVLLGGITALDHLTAAMNEGFDFVAMGRALIHDPALIQKMERGETAASGCVPCNACITEMDRPGGVCCARVPSQLERRAAEVARGDHVSPS
jgi:2,4-dienoyl-CoA reductase-like NADH-dependent reductase (Old Yellow Enzyme family)